VGSLNIEVQRVQGFRGSGVQGFRGSEGSGGFRRVQGSRRVAETHTLESAVFFTTSQNSGLSSGKIFETLS
jgi:hypothetical protein